MQKYINLTCGFCNKKFDLLEAEYKRQKKKGRDIFFCGLSCGAKYNNSKRPDRVYSIIKICPQCNKPFETVTGKLENTFCSRSCASSGSMTEHRRQRQREGGLKASQGMSSENAAKLLKVREAWRYIYLKEFLNELNKNYDFEHPFGPFVYDLALFYKNIFIEFDGPDHENNYQKILDSLKEKYASESNWSVVRIKIDISKPIPKEIIADII